MDLIYNKKVRYNYTIVEKFEAGIELFGTEVKSCRMKKISIEEGYISFENGEAFLKQVNIARYEMGNRNNHDPVRKRRLLLHKKEIRQLQGAVEAKGMTVVPTGMYLKKGLIKVGIALCKGKDTHDKRDTIKARQDDIKIQRIMKNR